MSYVAGKTRVNHVGFAWLCLGSSRCSCTLDWTAVRLDSLFFPPSCWSWTSQPYVIALLQLHLLPEIGLPGPETQPAPAPLQPDSRPLREQFASHQDRHLPLPSRVAGRLHQEHQPDPAAVSPQS